MSSSSVIRGKQIKRAMRYLFIFMRIIHFIWPMQVLVKMYETWDFHPQLGEKGTVFFILENKLIQSSQIKSMHIQEYIQLPNINITRKFLHRTKRRHGDDCGNLVMVTDWESVRIPLLEEKRMKCVGCTPEYLENQTATFMFLH